jgi:hypothetical protein
VTGIARPLTAPAEALSPGQTAPLMLGDPRRRVVLPVDDRQPGWRAVTAIARVTHGGEPEPVVTRIARHELLASTMRAILARLPADRSTHFAVAVELAELPGVLLEHARVADGRGRRAARALSAGLAVSR